MGVCVSFEVNKCDRTAQALDCFLLRSVQRLSCGASVAKRQAGTQADICLCASRCYRRARRARRSDIFRLFGTWRRFGPNPGEPAVDRQEGGSPSAQRSRMSKCRPRGSRLIGSRSLFRKLTNNSLVAQQLCTHVCLEQSTNNLAACLGSLASETLGDPQAFGPHAKTPLSPLYGASMVSPWLAIIWRCRCQLMQLRGGAARWVNLVCSTGLA